MPTCSPLGGSGQAAQDTGPRQACALVQRHECGRERQSSNRCRNNAIGEEGRDEVKLAFVKVAHSVAQPPDRRARRSCVLTPRVEPCMAHLSDQYPAALQLVPSSADGGLCHPPWIQPGSTNGGNASRFCKGIWMQGSPGTMINLKQVPLEARSVRALNNSCAALQRTHEGIAVQRQVRIPPGCRQVRLPGRRRRRQRQPRGWEGLVPDLALLSPAAAERRTSFIVTRPRVCHLLGEGLLRFRQTRHPIGKALNALSQATERKHVCV